MDKATLLRKKHPTFIYENFQYVKDGNSLKISFSFKIPPGIRFSPTVGIENINSFIFAKIGKSTIENFIFHLGLIEMVSYWKSTCSPMIDIKAGYLTKDQITWWKNLLLKGLGEFFYQNNINFKQNNFIDIKTSTGKTYTKDQREHQERYLVLNGGGRDSAVSIEFLKELKKEMTIFMLNPTKAMLDVAQTSGVKNQIIVKREIDKNLFKLNTDGFLNGHTPFSAYLAFLAVLGALLFDTRFVVPANERSSNEENIEFLGEKINHQYSKSYDFEKAFRQYTCENLSNNIDYFSLLRPLYEIQISKIFASYKKYFKSFKSCNRGHKNNIWCGQCPKCLSIYISLHPFIKEDDITAVFGDNLYEKKELLDLLLHLTGNKKPKPFECVGTYQEILEGLRLSVGKLEKQNEQLPYLLEYAKKNILSKNPLEPELLTAWDENNFLNKEIAEGFKTKIL